MLDKLLSGYDSLIAIDTETTGLDFKNDRIIELAAVKFIKTDAGLKVLDRFDEFIALPDGMRVPGEVEQLTGITNELLLEQGVLSEIVCQRFANLFLEERIMLTAYNAQFDMNFIYYFLQRHNSTEILKKINMLDAYTVYRDRREYPHKLENAIVAYNLQDCVVNSHRAIDDTLALVEVLKAMEAEEDDLHRYINLFGYNPKYGVSGSKISSVKYLPQYYNSYKKLYMD